MAFQLAQRMSAVMLMVLACPEFGFWDARPRPLFRTSRPRPLLRTRRPAAAHLFRTMCANQSRQSQQPHELRYRTEAAPAQTEK
jgi:hypothetical protein